MAITVVSRSQNDILRDVRQNLKGYVGVSADNETSTSLNLLQSISLEQANMWDQMNTLLKNNFLSTAFGTYLDEIGYMLQEPRASFQRALDLGSTNLKLYIDNTYAIDITDLLNRYLTFNDRTLLFSQGVIDSVGNPSLINIPSSLIVSTTDGGISYTTMKPMTISNNQQWDFSPIIATGIGSSYNVAVGMLTRHNLQSLVPILAKVISAIQVTNLFGIRSGEDSESDDNYRFRLSNKVVSAVSSNDASIRKAALSVPGVSDVSIVPRTHGNGTFTLFPKSTEPIMSDGLLMAVQSSVNAVMAAGSIAYSEAPNYLAVAFNIELRFLPGADKNSLYANTRLAIINYINNLDLGGEIVINEIIQIVMSVNDKIMDMNIPQFGFGVYDRHTGIISAYTPLRLVNQKADWNQKWYTNSSMCAICEAGSR